MGRLSLSSSFLGEDEDEQSFFFLCLKCQWRDVLFYFIFILKIRRRRQESIIAF